MEEDLRCHICHSSCLYSVIAGGGEYAYVSSDKKILQESSLVVLCGECETLQKTVDAPWLEAVERIYTHYDSSGAEPHIFDSIQGNKPYAQIMLDCLRQKVALPSTGKLLDVGCINGNFLSRFYVLFPAWKLYGIEHSSQCRESILALPGVEGFFSDYSDLEGERFNVIILSHVLELMPNPAAFLERMARFLVPNGLMLVSVPNIRRDPVDLFVFNHCTHFDGHTLAQLFARAGLHAYEIFTDILDKELIAVICANGAGALPREPLLYEQPMAQLCARYYHFADDLLHKANDMRSQCESFGIMGSSTQAVWLTASLSGAVDFYIDEDPGRAGSMLLGKPVVALADIPTGSAVLIPMLRSVAERIIRCQPSAAVRMEYPDSDEIMQADALKNPSLS